MVVATAILAKQLVLAKHAVVYIVDDKKNVLYTWKPLLNVSEPEDAISSAASFVEVKVATSKTIIEMISHSKIIHSSNTSQDTLFEGDSLRAFRSPPSEIFPSPAVLDGYVDQQYSTMLIGIPPTATDIFGCSDISSSLNSDDIEKSVAVIIQIFDRAEVFGQKSNLNLSGAFLKSSEKF
jgi:hypothetical protein